MRTPAGYMVTYETEGVFQIRVLKRTYLSAVDMARRLAQHKASANGCYCVRPLGTPLGDAPRVCFRKP